jgi:peroxidase
MLMAPSGDDESHSGADATLSPDAVDAVNKAKAAVEALPGCAGKVSCADILAMAARDVVSLVINQNSSPAHPVHISQTYRGHVMVRKEGYGAIHLVE